METHDLLKEEIKNKNIHEIKNAEEKIDPIVSKKHNLKKDWSANEDDLLIELINEIGTKNWKKVAENLYTKYKIKGRTGKQCRERWFNHLNPDINNIPLSENEERTMLKIFLTKGKKWAEMARKLPGRSDNAIKNHYYSSMRKEFRRLSKVSNQPFSFTTQNLTFEFMFEYMKVHNISLSIIDNANIKSIIQEIDVNHNLPNSPLEIKIKSKKRINTFVQSTRKSERIHKQSESNYKEIEGTLTQLKIQNEILDFPKQEFKNLKDNCLSKLSIPHHVNSLQKEVTLDTFKPSKSTGKFLKQTPNLNDISNSKISEEIYIESKNEDRHHNITKSGIISSKNKEEIKNNLSPNSNTNDISNEIKSFSKSGNKIKNLTLNIDEILNNEIIYKPNQNKKQKNFPIKNSNDRPTRSNHFPFSLNEGEQQPQLEGYQISPFHFQLYQRYPDCYQFPILKSPFHSFNMSFEYSPINDENKY